MLTSYSILPHHHAPFDSQQTVKELVDNAVDSCRWRSSEQDAPTVRVVLRRLPAGARNSNIEHTEERDPDEGANVFFNIFERTVPIRCYKFRLCVFRVCLVHVPFW